MGLTRERGGAPTPDPPPAGTLDVTGSGTWHVLTTSEPIGMVLTPEEYDSLPTSSRRELVDGVIRVMASPTSKHQRVVDALNWRLNAVCTVELTVVRIAVDDLLPVRTVAR